MEAHRVGHSEKIHEAVALGDDSAGGRLVFKHDLVGAEVGENETKFIKIDDENTRTQILTNSIPCIQAA